MVASTREPSFADLFTPKLVTVLRERYGLRDRKTDIVQQRTGMNNRWLPLPNASRVGEQDVFSAEAGHFREPNPYNIFVIRSAWLSLFGLLPCLHGPEKP